MKKYPKIGIRPTIDGRQGGVRESLEEKTMNLAKAVAELITSNLKNGDGTPVECVIADGTIGRVAESAACAEKFEREGVGATITVTSCWCYGAETMDMNPYYPKAVWGFNGTERPGAVYLAAVLAGHAQKGLPAFGIYGRDVQDLNDNSIPADVAEKILRFARAAQAVATMRGKSYLSMGSVSMGIAGSIVNPDFFQEYLGMRNESIDLTEIIRRMAEGIYDKEEYAKAMAWTEKYCKKNEGNDFNIPEKTKTRAQKDEDWEFIVKMTIIMRDLMQGNPKLKELGFKEEALGHNAIAAGFQGQRQWTDFYPNGDFSEALRNTSFDWNGIREAFVVATENDACNGVAMLFGHLLTNRAQIFSDVRTYWSPEAVKRVTGKELTGMAANGIIHLINSGATTLDGTGQQTNANGEPAMKPCWEITEGEVDHKITGTFKYPSNRKLKDTINNIGDGIENAVAENMKSERMKTDLITNVSHDLKTPLTSIINYVDLLKTEGVDSKNANKYLDILDKKSQRLKNLTEDLVEASKLTSGAIELHKEKINIVELINQSLGEYNEKLNQRNLTVVKTIPDKAIYINADGRRMWRVFENLYGNIFKYAMEGTRVYVDVEEHNGEIVIGIKNISEKALNISPDELMDRFVRGDQSRSTEGSGLGLSIAKTIIERHDGTMEIILDGDLFKVVIAIK